MPITEYLKRNASLYGDEVALVELNPQVESAPRSWREFDLVETEPQLRRRTELTWKAFNARSNQFAHMLQAIPLAKGEKVAILLMNCLEWLPVYFGVLKSGALSVPLNYRYTADEIRYCVDLAEADVLVFGPEFIDRVAAVKEKMPRLKKLYFVGPNCPDFAESYDAQVVDYPTDEPDMPLTDEDYAAIYFSSGTTGFPRPSCISTNR